MLRLKERVSFDYINPLLIKDCPHLYFSSEQILSYTDNLDNYYNVARNVGVKFLYDDINFFKEVKSEQNHLQYGEYHMKNYCCYVPRLSAYIDCPTAQVFPCDCTIHRNPKEYCCGNLLEQSFGVIWHGKYMGSLRKKLENSTTLCKLNCDSANIFINKKIDESEYK